jgi:dTDP-4-dehydrorhamnose reductase/dTDP-4-dehydrorhamnose 3,5-epimerase
MSEFETPEIEMKKELKSYETSIPGLILFDLTVNGDNRGWFKENFQEEKMVKIGIPEGFKVVQNNISFNTKRGATRGLHAEPWDKFVSVANGRILGAWVDLREGSPTFQQSFSVEMDASHAIFVPRGVANGYQALEDDTIYTYIVNDHWSEESLPLYTFVNVADPALKIEWPIPLNEAELSDKDLKHPFLAQVKAMKPRKTLVTGANGQVGRALRNEFPDAEFVTREEFDITSADLDSARQWRQYDTIINAAAYTAVDSAETDEGRVEAWKSNASAIASLARIATKYSLTFVNISSDYVFDGTQEIHTEDEVLSPLGVYGQTKAAGDVITSSIPKHYTIRTSWVIGEGNNFVRTMKSLADRDIKPSVINDQIGRLSFSEDIAKAIKHLLTTKAEYGTYNVSNEGEPVSWADVAKKIYESVGKSVDDVTPVSTLEYYADKEGIAPRPLQSTLSLDKLKATGFVPRDWQDALTDYLNR